MEIDALRPILRTLLEELFKTSTDFEAFFVDYFLEVRRLCTPGMDRTQQITFLLSRLVPHQILSALVQHYKNTPQILRYIEHRAVAANSDQAQAEAEINQKILDLTQEVALRREQGLSIDNFIEKLREQKKKRRELREAPGLRPGHELGGRYKLLTPIGRGGFAAVWHAFDYKAQMSVAIKVLHSEHGSSPASVDRFNRGARSLQILGHNNIVKLIEEPTVDEGYHYAVLEYAAGGDLEDAILRLLRNTDSAMQAVLQIADALIFAHRRGFVHRDVKPKNILLFKNELAKLADFDLVRAADSTGGTRTGAIGTLLYAAPEQREDGSRVDERADIYSLGMTAVFALYGRRLPTSVLENDGRHAFIANLDCPRLLRAVLRRAVEADPSMRYQRMADFRKAFARTIALQPQPVVIEVLSTSTPTRSAINRYIIGVLGAMALSAILCVFLYRQHISQNAATSIAQTAVFIRPDGSSNSLMQPIVEPLYLDAGSEAAVETPAAQANQEVQHVKLTNPSKSGLPIDKFSPQKNIVKNLHRQKIENKKLDTLSNREDILDTEKVNSQQKPELASISTDANSPALLHAAPSESIPKNVLESVLNNVNVNKCKTQEAIKAIAIMITIKNDGHVSEVHDYAGGDENHDKQAVNCIVRTVKSDAVFPEFTGSPARVPWTYVIK